VDVEWSPDSSRLVAFRTREYDAAIQEIDMLSIQREPPLFRIGHGEIALKGSLFDQVQIAWRTH
jgi:hypothetical protein